MLLDLGARPAGQWQSGHMSPIDAKAPDFETPQHEDGRGNTQSRYDYPFGITVNALGAALLRRRRGAAFLHLCQDRPRRARPAGRARLPDLRSEGPRRACAIRTTRRHSSRPTRSRSLRREGRARADGAHAHGRGIQPRRAGRPAVRSAPSGRQGHQGPRDSEIELGDPHRRAAVPRLSGHLRHHLHVRRRRGEPATRR